MIGGRPGPRPWDSAVSAATDVPSSNGTPLTAGNENSRTADRATATAPKLASPTGPIIVPRPNC